MGKMAFVGLFFFWQSLDTDHGFLQAAGASSGGCRFPESWILFPAAEFYDLIQNWKDSKKVSYLTFILCN